MKAQVPKEQGEGSLMGWNGETSSQRLPGEFCRAKGNWPGGGKSPEMALRMQRPGGKMHGHCSNSMKTGLVKVHEE